MRKVLITGATGFLGRYILKSVLEDENVAPVILARGKKGESAAGRVRDTMRYLYGDASAAAMLKRVSIVEGEVDKKDLGIDKDAAGWLINDIDEIFHSAAIAEFRVPLDVIRKSNVEGTRNLLEFALLCRRSGRLEKVNHISTTYLVGDRPGVFYENELSMGQGFNNTYEQSKFEAETLIRRYKEAGLPISVFRPSILTGDSAGGRTNNFKMLYQPLHFFANELFDAVPARHSSEQNLMPADIAASQIVAIAKNPDSFGKTFHIASLSTMTVGHFVDVASDFFGFKAPEFIPVEEFDRSRLSNVQRFLIEPFVPYFNYKIRFDITNAARALKASHAAPYAFSDDTLLKLFTFCADSGFIKPKRQYVAS